MTNLEVAATCYAAIGALYACFTGVGVLVALSRGLVRVNGIEADSRMKGMLGVGMLCKLVGTAVLWPLALASGLGALRSAPRMIEEGVDLSMEDFAIIVEFHEGKTVEHVQPQDEPWRDIIYRAHEIAKARGLEDPAVTVAAVRVSGARCDYSLMAVFGVGGWLMRDVSKEDALMDSRRGQVPKRNPPS